MKSIRVLAPLILSAVAIGLFGCGNGDTAEDAGAGTGSATGTAGGTATGATTG